MDGLKQINDQYGHRAGDAAIKEFASRLKAGSRQSDTIARLGGDEFGIILFQVNTRENAKLCIQRFKEKVEKPFKFDQHELDLCASVGLAIFPEDGNDPDVLVDKADQVMYADKKSKKNK
jgi:diguanylate cyclase (GGDEF)-like protein